MMTKSEATEWVYDQDEQGEIDRDDLRDAFVALLGRDPGSDDDQWSLCCAATPNCGTRQNDGLEVIGWRADKAAIDQLTSDIISRGETFSGGRNNAPTLAAEWLDYSGEWRHTPAEWMDVGVWSPSTADDCEDANLSPAAIKELCDRKGKIGEWRGKNVGVDLIYALCNGDVTIEGIEADEEE